MRRKFLRILALCLFLALVISASGAEDGAILLKKSQLLVQKGVRAEERGEFEDAALFYEEALEVYPKNMMPLLRLGKLLARIGMYEKAAERLRAIPLEQLPKAGRSEIHSLFGQIALARGSLEEAGAAYRKAIEANSENVIALVRKIIIERLLGFSTSKENLDYFMGYDTFKGLPYKDIQLAFYLDMEMWNFARAYNTCEVIEQQMAAAAEGGGSSADKLLNSAPVTFILSLPLCFQGVIGIIYYCMLFGALVFLATVLSGPTAIWHNFFYVFAASALLLAAQHLGYRDMIVATMQSDFSEFDSVWIIPKLLIAGHFVALALFVVFPAFRILPAEQRPLRYELFGIWFFCWFFMIFVLVFQSRLGFATRAAYMGASGFMALLTMLIMPLGRFVIFNVASAAGFSGVVSVDRKNIQKDGSISFTDAKILESQASKCLEKDAFEEVVLTGRKVLGNLDRKTFVALWRSMILAMICREDYVEAQRSINEYLETFKDTSQLESGQLLDAYLRCRKGDFATAVVIIRGFSEKRAKMFSNDETALCLLVLGCCGTAFKEYVQAHIDFGKALNCVKLPFLKAEILTELAELDFMMNAKEALTKWKAKVGELNGGEKTASLKKVILSIAALSEGARDESMRLAAEACKSKARNGRAFAWYGHLLCLEGRHSEAEELLSNMTPESYDAIRLMNETTGTGS
ncbi:hypothetical protein MASR1M12_26880 [Erysipelotrichia bacterium]